MNIRVLAGVACMVVILSVGHAEEKKQKEKTLKVATHLVTLSVIATDKDGPVTNLTKDDFELFEKRGDVADNVVTAWASRQVEQHIADFHYVEFYGVDPSPAKPTVSLPDGMYSNLHLGPLSAPPTILLLDALNTEPDHQSNARRRILECIQQLPPKTPIAVYLLGHQLHLLQDLTVKSDLVIEAVKRAMSADTMVETKPVNDPNGGGNVLEDFSKNMDALQPKSANGAGGPQLGAQLKMVELFLRGFEAETHASRLDIEVGLTLKALEQIAGSVRGYPGRKTLIWVSGSFPLFLQADRKLKESTLAFRGQREYGQAVQRATNAINNAEISIYPVDAAGLRMDNLFDPSNGRKGDNAKEWGEMLEDSATDRFALRSTLLDVADLTGGVACVDNNDLAGCVRRDIQDGAKYYEMDYYPSAGDWNTEYRRIILKCKRPGVKLRYREGYYAGDMKQPREVNVTYKVNGKKVRLYGPQLTALIDTPFLLTGIGLTAKAIAPDNPGELKYDLRIDPKTLSFLPLVNTGQRERELDLEFGWAQFDEHGNTVGLYQYVRKQTLTEAQYQIALARGVGHSVAMVLHPKVTRVRLLVCDSASQTIGTIDIPVSK